MMWVRFISWSLIFSRVILILPSFFISVCELRQLTMLTKDDDDDADIQKDGDDDDGDDGYDGLLLQCYIFYSLILYVVIIYYLA